MGFKLVFYLPPGQQDPEARMLASSTCELLHPHRIGAQEQPYWEPQSPADLQLHQVRT